VIALFPMVALGEIGVGSGRYRAWLAPGGNSAGDGAALLIERDAAGPAAPS